MTLWSKRLITFVICAVEKKIKYKDEHMQFGTIAVIMKNSLMYGARNVVF